MTSPLPLKSFNHLYAGALACDVGLMLKPLARAFEKNDSTCLPQVMHAKETLFMMQWAAAAGLHQVG